MGKAFWVANIKTVTCQLWTISSKSQGYQLETWHTGEGKMIYILMWPSWISRSLRPKRHLSFAGNFSKMINSKPDTQHPLDGERSVYILSRPSCISRSLWSNRSSTALRIGCGGRLVFCGVHVIDTENIDL